MILKMILLGNLLLQPLLVYCQATDLDERFQRAVEYWTETLCSLPKTKTFVFHGVFSNGSKNLRDLFDVLLHTTSDYCNAVVLLKIHTVQNFYRNHSLIAMRHRKQSLIPEARIKGFDIKREAMLKLVSRLNHFRREWKLRKNWREIRKYHIDMWNVNIIFLEDSSVFEKLLDSAAPLEWSNREHFIMLAVWNDHLEKLNDRTPLIDRTLKKLWLEYHIQNVFLNEPLSNNKIYNMYSYNPFAVVNETTWGKLEMINTTSKMEMLYSLSTLTQRRTINFNGITFNVSIFDQVQEGMKIQGKIKPGSIFSYSGGYNGSSGILLGVIAKKVNFKVNVIEPNTEEVFGNQLANGTFTGAIGDVVYHRVIGSFASFFVKKYANDMSGFEFTTVNGFDKVCALTPKAHKIPKGLRIYHIFHLSVWLTMLLSHILVYLAWYYVQVFAPERSKRVDVQATALHLFSIGTGCPVSLPKAWSERSLLTGFFFSSLTMIGLFNSVLYKAFAQDMFYKDVDTLFELDATGLPIGTFSYSLADLFGPQDDPDLDPVSKRLQKRMIYAPNNVEQAALYRNITGLLREQYFPLMHESLVDEHGDYMLHKVKECPAQFYLACILPTKSIFRNRINILIGRLNQAGLPTLWRRRTVLKGAFKRRINIEVRHKGLDRHFIPFQLNDMQASFYLLAIGLLSSIVIFFHEKGWLLFPFCKARSTYSTKLNNLRLLASTKFIKKY